MMGWWRRRWLTVWDDGTVDKRFFTHRFADHRRWGINSTAAAMGSERRLTVESDSAARRQATLLAVFQANPGIEYYALDLAREVDVPSGSIYPALISLEECGLVESRWAEKEPGSDFRRRLYFLAGKEHDHE